MVCFLFLVLCLVSVLTLWLVCFFFNATATAKIDTYGHTLSLHDALPIYPATRRQCSVAYLLRKYVRARANPAHSRSCRRNGHWVTQQQRLRFNRTKPSSSAFERRPHAACRRHHRNRVCKLCERRVTRAPLSRRSDLRSLPRQSRPPRPEEQTDKK